MDQGGRKDSSQAPNTQRTFEQQHNDLEDLEIEDLEAVDPNAAVFDNNKTIEPNTPVHDTPRQD
jgi:hypothetical protein